MAEASEKKERHKAETQLHAQTGELRALAARLQAIREDERIRIARELHDEMGEALMAQKFGLLWLWRRLEQEPVPKVEMIAKIGELGRLIDGTANRVREVCADLRPSILDDLGISAAIEWQAQEFQTRTGIVCEIFQGVDLLDLDEQHATTVFRIFQEILTNVARHAKATRVHGRLGATGAVLLLAVTDNGKGIGAGEACGGKSLGLLGMRERAALLGGKVAISSTPGNGTTVMVTIPFMLKSGISKSGGNRKNDPICE
jgi:signal transduction histidine kinase